MIGIPVEASDASAEPDDRREGSQDDRFAQNLDPSRAGRRGDEPAPTELGVTGNGPEALAACFDEGVVTREDLWITSKLWNDRHAEGDVVPAIRRIGELDRGFRYVDGSEWVGEGSPYTIESVWDEE